ncbi:uncharacterized protein K460DRAFT_358488 [Cucurbitaria berberidis CBS 394.84]|uniref:Uncharacterized protein n=1 Tax=Cucurbitaria berberidis CBS 394.84 TaxID=1168544 RepID=A0A9P4GA31_9PLEO|nr:uncharacterized protein K460DRAFT_358488 [Cucurbitaria berberidis CBS 394.84]KAF1841786.1 hypothetical protein K460DRAFT_358488 [Cucurbitaria berberidis CBS 394.84]
MPSRGTLQLFKRSSTGLPLNKPPSPPLSFTDLPEYEPETSELPQKSNGVLSLFNPGTFPMHKRCSERIQPSTPPASPIYERPLLAGRSKTAPATCQHRFGSVPEMEYTNMSIKRRKAAHGRVNGMRNSLGLNVLKESADGMITSAAAEPPKLSTTREPASCEETEAMNTATTEPHRRRRSTTGSIDHYYDHDHDHDTVNSPYSSLLLLQAYFH